MTVAGSIVGRIVQVPHFGAMLGSHLDHSARFPRDLADELALINGQGHRLLAVDVLAGLQRRDQNGRVPVIGCAERDHMDVAAFEGLAIVLLQRQVDSVRLESENVKTGTVISDRAITAFRDNQILAELKRIERMSATLGAQPPKDATVLFDGKSTDSWNDGVVQNGLLANTNVLTKEPFHDYTLHLEFRTPYKPWRLQKCRGRGTRDEAGG